MKRKMTAGRLGLYIVSALFLILLGFPFLFMLLTSFKDKAEYLHNYWLPPKNLYLGNFETVFQTYFLRYFLNSLLVSVISVAVIIFLSSMAAYALATMKFKLNNAIMLLFLAGMMIPIHTALIPTYVLTNELGLQDRTLGLIGPYVSFGLPVSIYIMSGFFREVPASIRESAVVDGASPFVVYARIMLPLSMPAVATVSIYNFLQCWNEFIFALTLISSTSQKTLSIGIREFSAFEAVNIPAVVTAILVGSLPVIIFYFFAQEQVINGLSSGAVKE